MKYSYSLSLANQADLKRICALLTKYTEIMEILNADSKHSLAGGAHVSYEVKIELKEKWV